MPPKASTSGGGGGSKKLSPLEAKINKAGLAAPNGVSFVLAGSRYKVQELMIPGG